MVSSLVIRRQSYCRRQFHISRTPSQALSVHSLISKVISLCHDLFSRTLARFLARTLARRLARSLTRTHASTHAPTTSFFGKISSKRLEIAA